MKGIEQGSHTDLNSFCEKNLFQKFSSGLTNLREESKQIELLNEEKFPDNISMKLVDFKYTVGCSIDREENKGKKLKFFKKVFRDYYELYMPAEMIDDELPANLELLIRVETNLKLNVIDNEGKSVIAKDDVNDDEYHFIRFESSFY